MHARFDKNNQSIIALFSQESVYIAIIYCNLMKKKAFFKLPLFAVVGASTERAKFGNKVLRAYIDNSFQAVPINKKQDIIEGMHCVDSLTTLASTLSKGENYNGVSNPAQVGVSIITPPNVTKLILEEGVGLGYSNFFLQPGTCNDEVEDYILELKGLKPKINIIQGCVLVELGFDEHS